MMFTTRTIPLLVTFFALSMSIGGCGLFGGKAPEDPLTQRAAIGDLAATIGVDRGSVRVGESLTVRLTAENVGNDPIQINATSAALMRVTVWEYDGQRWQPTKRYPEVAAQVMTPWALAPKASREFATTIPVEPDWPVLQNVKITAELNGRPDVRPYVMVEARPIE